MGWRKQGEGFYEIPTSQGKKQEAQRGQATCPKGTQLVSGKAVIQSYSSQESVLLTTPINCLFSKVDFILYEGKIVYREEN